jgi:ArsR family transcriptional regulator
LSNNDENDRVDTATRHPIVPAVRDESLAALQALAEPTRARIMVLLGHGEHCVCDVGDALGLSTALVSHHLRVLRSTGLLRERRAGRWVFYALDLERLAGLRADLDALLTPTDAAAATCLCSECGTKSAATGRAPQIAALARPGRGGDEHGSARTRMVRE